jgi:hypothetical protein
VAQVARLRRVGRHDGCGGAVAGACGRSDRADQSIGDRPYIGHSIGRRYAELQTAVDLLAGCASPSVATVIQPTHGVLNVASSMPLRTQTASAELRSWGDSRFQYDFTLARSRRLQATTNTF